MENTEKLKRIKALDEAITEYTDLFLELNDDHGIHRFSFGQKILVFFGIKKYPHLETQYASTNKDEELREIVESHIENKIRDMKSELDELLCGDSDGDFPVRGEITM